MRAANPGRLFALVAVVAGTFVACHDFDALYEDCAQSGRCGGDGGTVTPGGDGGNGGTDDGGTSDDGGSADGGPIDAGPKLDAGEGCSTGADCLTGNCVDGVCCDLDVSACTGCSACNVPGFEGTCTPVPSGQDPHEACTADPSQCRADVCDGTGGCGVATGATCAAAQCANDMMSTFACATDGGCIATTISCAPSACGDAGTCDGMCVTGTTQGCTTGFVCTNGTCVAQKPKGTACQFDAQCLTGNCVDGFCCDQPSSTCSGCYTCSLTPGTCKPVQNGNDPHGFCNADPANCIAAACNGNGACTAQNGTNCGSVCVTNTLVALLQCSGGACTQQSNTVNCPGTQVCDAGMCVASGTLSNGSNCTSASQCTSNFCVDGVCCDSACNGNCQSCNQAGGNKGKCTPALSGTDPDNDCGLYECSGNATCFVSCTNFNATTRCKSAMCSAGVCAP